MLKSTILAALTAGLMWANTAPASAAAAASGVKAAPAVSSGVVLVRRGGGGGFRGFGGGGGGFRGLGGGGGGFRGLSSGGGGFRGLRGGGGRHVYGGGRRHHGHGHRLHRRGWSGGIYLAAPYLYYRSYGYSDCRWLRRKAIRTGSSYWWRRYNRCRDRYDW